MERLALFTAGIVFLLVAIMHLLRVVFKIEVKLRTFTVPLWLSGVGFIFALSLAVWMFISRCP